RVTKTRRIYVASSWRNARYPDVVRALVQAGHEVYDFRHPRADGGGLSWREIHPDWQAWTTREYVRQITSAPRARGGFALAKAALDWCNTCVLVLPCGRSAHLEAGYAVGRGKDVIFLLAEDEGFEPELMYLLGHGFAFDCTSLLNTLDALA